MDTAPRHIFVSYESDTELRESAASLLAKGLHRREMVVYASPHGEDHVGEALARAVGTELLGRFATRPLDALYQEVQDTSPREALEASLAGHLEEVSRQGLAGLRVMALSTSLVDFPYWGRWEYEVGRRTTMTDLTVICAYDVRAIDRETLGDLAALHQELRSLRPFTSFCLFPTADGLALVGDVDATSSSRLERTLATVDTAGLDQVAIDVSELRFINHDGLLTIDSFARRDAVQVRLVGASPTLCRLHEVLGLDSRVIEAKP